VFRGPRALTAGATLLGMLRSVTALGCLLLLPGCGGSALAQCRIDAVHDAALALPADETEVSVGMVLDLVRRLTECRALAAPSSVPDGGVPP